MGKTKTPCWSCGRPLADRNSNKCYGCGHVVCATCCQKYGHGNHLGGRYAKQLKTVEIGAHARRGYLKRKPGKKV